MAQADIIHHCGAVGRALSVLECMEVGAVLARVGKAERAVAWTVSGIFNICILKALMVIGAILGITVFMSDAPEPSGWSTQRDYEASADYSLLWLFVFVFVVGIIVMFFNIVIVVYCLVAWVLLLVWITNTIGAALSRQGGKRGGLKLMLAALIGLKMRCTEMCVSKGLRQNSYIFRFILATAMGFAYVPFTSAWFSIFSSFMFFPQGILRQIVFRFIQSMYCAGVAVLFLL